ncbi:WhiB family transcriptional regulator [Rhodococcus tibetensis]|uniref:Transcriptional regulator WhiB n=1 Tax=Rhodococcus tibetensis TaxID=2965064 RepID=A0ABT1QBQ8_9NOCA|nr:WhiB family transcriptional regulator [Rhodococcus sp. FXJ9.536]MCQ4119703.1 WhiB family transcriptional regulator [Rhodococcus sp. FXJ9.536]
MLPAGTAPIPASETATTEAVGWQDRATCRGAESSVFFSPDKERGHARARRETRARQICQDCPVLTACRDHAPAAGEPYGIWGGMTETERRRHTRSHRHDDRRPPPPKRQMAPSR